VDVDDMQQLWLKNNHLGAPYLSLKRRVTIQACVAKMTIKSGAWGQNRQPPVQTRHQLQYRVSKGTPLLANFTKASLIVPETQAVARLLLEYPDAERWRQAIEVDNVLQAKTVNTAKSYANIARMRLETMTEELWDVIANAERPTAVQAILACALKFSPMLAEFMRTSLADEYRRMSPVLEDRVWRSFFADMALNHRNLAEVSEGTQAKLRQNAYRILTEAGYLAKNKARSLQHVRVLPEIRGYLTNYGQQDILSAMDCAH
tara:strand:+ start:65 stop:847 length:783 start_codon:yes stop_codon:yes gene_type:complete